MNLNTEIINAFTIILVVVVGVVSIAFVLWTTYK